ncbi:MAG: PfkB family carbohydrate kinase [Deinococcota bacterium]
MKERIALGFGNNIDYEIVWNTQTIEDLVVDYAIQYEDIKGYQPICHERDLVISILSFLQAGSGGERIVVSNELLEQFAQKFTKKITLGGTPVRAAIAMRKLGYTAALHLVTMNDQVAQLLPKDCPYVCSNEQASFYPHLIVQFAQNTVIKVGDKMIHAARSNRIIYHNDEDNQRMRLSESFAELISSARILLISGFNAISDTTLLAKSTKVLEQLIATLPKGALLFYEDAGNYEPACRQMMLELLTKRPHIVSLNEDEFQEYVGKKLDFVDAQQVKDGLLKLRQRLPEAHIIIHTDIWGLVFSPQATRFAKSLQAGMTMATARFCFGDGFTQKDCTWVETLSPNADGAAVSTALASLLGENIIVLPVADVAPPTPTTIGLGDAFVGGFIAEYAS